MAIGWYPGHMHKARKDITKLVQQVDAVIELVDARLPYSSENPMLNQLIGSKPRLRILNKADLANPEVTRQWLEYYNSKNMPALAMTRDDKHSITRCLDYFKANFKTQGSHKLYKIMIVGIPNVGKSSFLNTLLDRKVAKVGNEPAVTKKKQEVALNNNLSVFDTPGVLWPKIENQNSAYRLAASGAIRNTAIEFDDIALYLLDYLKIHEKEALKTRYQLDDLTIDSSLLLEEIGRKRGCLRKGGVDFIKAGEMLINDLRNSMLGRISLETPESAAREQLEMYEENTAS